MSECTNGELRDLLPELVNGRLDAELQRHVEAHVAACAECADGGDAASLAAAGTHERAGDRHAANRGGGARADVRSRPRRGRARDGARRGASRSRRPRWSRWARLGYAVVTRGRAAPESIAVRTPDSSTGDSAHAAAAPIPAPVAPAQRTAPAPVPPQQVAVAAPAAQPTASRAAECWTISPTSRTTTCARSPHRSTACPRCRMRSRPPEVDPLGASLDEHSSDGT